MEIFLLKSLQAEIISEVCLHLYWIASNPKMETIYRVCIVWVSTHEAAVLLLGYGTGEGSVWVLEKDEDSCQDTVIFIISGSSTADRFMFRKQTV